MAERYLLQFQVNPPWTVAVGGQRQCSGNLRGGNAGYSLGNRVCTPRGTAQIAGVRRQGRATVRRRCPKHLFHSRDVNACRTLLARHAGHARACGRLQILNERHCEYDAGTVLHAAGAQTVMPLSAFCQRCSRAGGDITLSKVCVSARDRTLVFRPQ